MLHTIRDQARTASHNWINEKTKLLHTIEFEGLEGTYDVWELVWQSPQGSPDA